MCIKILTLLCCLTAIQSPAEDIELFMIAGQSNAQGLKGDAAKYPVDPTGGDDTIRFFWVTPGFSNSGNKWTTMRAQGGAFKQGHFGLEVTFARALKSAGHNVAVFKFTRSNTTLAKSWRRPGKGGMYDDMVKAYRIARGRLEAEGHTVLVRAFVWVQGESDAANPAIAKTYESNLKALIGDVRTNVAGDPKLPVILGIDEQFRGNKKNPEVLAAHKRFADADPRAIFTSMMGLKKADHTHLTPAGLIEHGKRIFEGYRKLADGASR